jgi:methylmalonyl-CoA mutase
MDRSALAPLVLPQHWDKITTHNLKNHENIQGYWADDKTLVLNGTNLTFYDQALVLWHQNKPINEKVFQKDAWFVDARFFHNLGASHVQELAYIMGALEAFITHSNGQPQSINIAVAVGENFFFEVAKIRALRYILNGFLSQNNLTIEPYIYTENALRNWSSMDVYNNMIRCTLQGMASILGGTNGLYLHPYNQISQSDDVLAQEWALKSQIILLEESSLAVFRNMANGSYYVESITEQLIKNALFLSKEIRQQGGYIAYLNNGKLKSQIQQTAKKTQDLVDSGKKVLVGVNKFQPKNESAPKTINPNSPVHLRLSEKIENR